VGFGEDLGEEEGGRCDGAEKMERDSESRGNGRDEQRSALSLGLVREATQGESK